MPKEGLVNGINCYIYVMSHNALQHSIWSQEFSYPLWSGNETVLNSHFSHKMNPSLSVYETTYMYVFFLLLPYPLVITIVKYV